jgi:hypothetical protein
MDAVAYRALLVERIAACEARGGSEDSLAMTLVGRSFRGLGARYELLGENQDGTKTVGITLAATRRLLAKLDANLV